MEQAPMQRDAYALLAARRWATGTHPARLRPVAPTTATSWLRVGIIDQAFTADLADAVGGPSELRHFGPEVIQTGAAAAHGTAMACAVTGALPPRGGAPGARVLCAATGDASPAAIVRALVWLAEEGAHVVVLPFGSVVDDWDVAVALRALRDRRDPPTVFASLGNGAAPPGLFPARMPGVVSVGAADDDGHPFATGRPPAAAALLAPGDRIAVRTGVFTLRPMSGTSIACAIAAGTALRKLALDRLSA